MTQAICGVNASCYPRTEETSTSSGGAAATSGAGGSEGAGNVEKHGEPEANLKCLPEAAVAIKDCASAILTRSLTGALVCGLRLDQLRECLSSK